MPLATIFYKRKRKGCNIVSSFLTIERSVWRYQRGNQNPYIQEGQTTQWPKEKGQKVHVVCNYKFKWISHSGFKLTFICHDRFDRFNGINILGLNCIHLVISNKTYMSWYMYIHVFWQCLLLTLSFNHKY